MHVCYFAVPRVEPQSPYVLGKYSGTPLLPRRHTPTFPFFSPPYVGSSFLMTSGPTQPGLLLGVLSGPHSNFFVPPPHFLPCSLLLSPSLEKGSLSETLRELSSAPGERWQRWLSSGRQVFPISSYLYPQRMKAGAGQACAKPIQYAKVLIAAFRGREHRDSHSVMDQSPPS